MGMMSVQEAAEYLGVAVKTLQNWICANKNIPYYRYPDRTSKPRFKKEDLDRYIERHRVNAREKVRRAS